MMLTKKSHRTVICLLLAATLTALFLSACSPDGQEEQGKYDPFLGANGNGQEGQGKYNLIMRTNDDVNRFSLDTKYFVCYFNNGSDYRISTGPGYSLEVKKGLFWEESDATVHYTLQNYGMQPGMSIPIFVTLNATEAQKHPLAAGHYRVKKDVIVNGEEAFAYFEFYMIP